MVAARRVNCSAAMTPSRGHVEVPMRRILVGVIAATLGAGAFAVIREGTREQAWIVGGLLLAVGVPLLALARWQLGRAFAFTPAAKGLVTHGLYSRIPHPMYVFLDTVLLGVVVLLRQAWLLVLLVGLAVLQAWQAGREARVLELKFGTDYRAYRTRTWW
jgi:protein-S-isoprenylcysteine O-methyltransferase Ste14